TFAGAIADLTRGRLEDVERSLTDVASVVDNAGLAFASAWVHQLLAQSQLFSGDFEAAMRSFLHSEEVARRHGSVNVLAMPILGTAVVLALTGHHDAADRGLAKARAQAA